jgi:hypothetical protein
VGEYVSSFTHSKTKSWLQNCHSTLKKRQYCGIGVCFGKQKLCSKHAMVMSNMQCVTQRLRVLLLTICSELAVCVPPQYIFMVKVERSSIAEVDFIILETMNLVTLFLSVLFANGNWSLTRPELYCLQLQNKMPRAQDGYKLLYFLYREK